MIIIGIDPGLANTGYGVIEFKDNVYSYIGSGVIRSKTDLSLADRLLKLHNELSKIFNLYKPESAAIEKTYVNVSSGSSLKLAHARSAAMLSAKIFGIDIAEYQAKTIKKTLTGSGSADKMQMLQMVNYFMPKAQIASADEADALAIAICHGFYFEEKKS